MGRLLVGLFLVGWLTACNQVFGIPDIKQEPPDQTPHHIGGRVHGLWDGADGVVLRLQANGVDTTQTVSSNGAFQFESEFRAGTSYTVTVTNYPAHHTCSVNAGGNGVVSTDDVTAISVACAGPEVMVTLFGPMAWRFDPTEEIQSYPASIVQQGVSLMIEGDAIDSVRVAGFEVGLGEVLDPIAFLPGMTTVSIAVKAKIGITKTYNLDFARSAAQIEQLAYGKASNADLGDQFGETISLSGDTLAVGASGEDSNAPGINGDQSNNVAYASGAAYVFVRSGARWTQQAYIKASNPSASNFFGPSVSLSGDALAVGCIHESGVAIESGAVYVFVRSGATWTQQALLRPSNTSTRAHFGASVALSGGKLAVGVPDESGVASQSGAVYVFERSGTTWPQKAYIKAPNPHASDHFGASVALSGETLVVGATGESSAATGIGGDQMDTSARGAGAVYVFQEIAGTWPLQAYIKASNTGPDDIFGASVSVSGDELAVGAPEEGSAAMGVNGAQGDNSAAGAGATYVFVRNASVWAQQAYLKASNTRVNGHFGSSVALVGDTVAVSAPGDSSASKGLNGDQSDGAASDAGAVYVFTRNGTTWSQQAFVKASNTDAGDRFGRAVALTADTLAVGASGEASSSSGINGKQDDNSAGGAGAVYVFR
jgi:hypothetical protein